MDSFLNFCSNQKYATLDPNIRTNSFDINYYHWSFWRGWPREGMTKLDKCPALGRLRRGNFRKVTHFGAKMTYFQYSCVFKCASWKMFAIFTKQRPKTPFSDITKSGPPWIFRLSIRGPTSRHIQDFRMFLTFQVLYMSAFHSECTIWGWPPKEGMTNYQFSIFRFVMLPLSKKSGRKMQ